MISRWLHGLGPPMEVRLRAHDRGCPLESEATLRLHFLSRIAAMKLPVGSRRMGERPQPLGRRQFGCRGRQAVPRQASRDTPGGAALPTGPIAHEEKLVAMSRGDRLGKRLQGAGACGDGPGREPPPPRTARGRRPKGGEGAPLVAVLPHRLGPLATGTPHPAQDWCEPKPLRVGRPSCSGLRRTGLVDGLASCREGCLTAAGAAGSALRWRGLGPLDVQPRRRRSSPPRGGGPGCPTVAAIQAAALGPVQTPPSGGGSARAVVNVARCAGDHRPTRPGCRCRGSPSPAGPVW